MQVQVKTMLIASLLLSTLPSTAFFDSWTNKKGAICTSLVPLGLSLKYFYLDRKPQDIEPAYNLKELKEGINVLENLKLLIRDGWIGQRGKKGRVILKSEDGGLFEIQQGEKIKPFGVYGYLDANYKYLLSITTILTIVYKMLDQGTLDITEVLRSFVLDCYDPKKAASGYIEHKKSS